jgi:hypothetical protein
MAKKPITKPEEAEMEGVPMPPPAPSGPEQGSQVGLAPEEPMGLVVRGTVLRRSRRCVGQDQVEVVTYTVGPRMAIIEVWRPRSYWQIGEFVSVPVVPHVWQSTVTFRLERTDEIF